MLVPGYVRATGLTQPREAPAHSRARARMQFREVGVVMIGRRMSRPRFLAAMLAAAVPVGLGLLLAGAAVADTIGGGGWLIAPNGQLSAPMSAPMSAPCSADTCTTDHLSFILEPSPDGPQSLGTLKVAVKDASGTTITTDPRTVTLSINKNTAGFTCSGGLTADTVNGVATFADCNQDRGGYGYRIYATDTTAGATPLASGHTQAFTVYGPATQLQMWWYCTDCSSAVWGVGIPFTVQPEVIVTDANGIPVANDSTTQVTLALTSSPDTAASLTCAGGETMTVSAGVADFTGCQVNEAGDYTLTATSSPQGWTQSRTFTATGPGTPAQLALIQSPPATTYPSVGTIKVAVEDAYGTVVSGDTRSITLGFWPGSGASGALTCAGGLTQPAVAGIATFAGCWAPVSSNDYIAANDGGSLSVWSNPFNVIPVPVPVAPPVLAPKIALAVAASPATLPAAGGSATFTYTVTNPGTAPLSSVAVTDTACTPAYASGDANKDSVLEVGETWTYTCTAALTATTTDAAKASATYGGVPVSATASTTVTVGSAAGTTPVTLTDGIAAGVNRGTIGFGTRSLVVARNHYVTVLGRTSPSLAGARVEVWARSRTGTWHRLTSRIVAADGTVHYYARVGAWTAFQFRFAGDATHAPASSHGRIATAR